MISSGASIHILDDSGRNAAQIAHESGQKLILGYLAIAESCFQLAEQLLILKNIKKVTRSTQTETQSHSKIGLHLENRLKNIIDINLDETFSSSTSNESNKARHRTSNGTSMKHPATTSSPRKATTAATSGNVRTRQHEEEEEEEVCNILQDPKPPSLSPISDGTINTALSMTSSLVSNDRYSANFLYAESILSDVPNNSSEYFRTFMDQQSTRGSIFPASIAGTTYSDPDGRIVNRSDLSRLDIDRENGHRASPTVSNCTNEPQIESKAEMRRKMSRVSAVLNSTPKLVSPKRGLGSGPVLVGRLETVPEDLSSG